MATFLECGSLLPLSPAPQASLLAGAWIRMAASKLAGSKRQQAAALQKSIRRLFAIC
jgi:NAD(P)H-hydrate repair Nnr-like enzyme with NAD(P)H-hydrate dehydratase domain